MKNKFAVIGLGGFGTSVARTLASNGAEVIAIDAKEERVNALRDDVAYAIMMDATDIRTLKAQNVHDVDAAVVAIGEDFESLLLCTVHLMDLKIPRIIARAFTNTQQMILEKVGVEETVSPEEDAGYAMANRLQNPSFISFIPLPDNYEIVEIKPPSNVAGRTLNDIKLRQRYKLNLITIKRERLEKTGNGTEEKVAHVIGVPEASTKLHKEDTLILMGKETDIRRFMEINQ